LSAYGHENPLVQEPGKCFIIDTELPHSVTNEENTDRIILYILFYAQEAQKNRCL
jgi:hypothetical protein